MSAPDPHLLPDGSTSWGPDARVAELEAELETEKARPLYRSWQNAEFKREAAEAEVEKLREQLKTAELRAEVWKRRAEKAEAERDYLARANVRDAETIAALRAASYTDEDVERVAEALWALEGALARWQDIPPGDEGDEIRERYRDLARAALDAYLKGPA